MNNIFEYAPKELVMDAFLCWCFNVFNSEDAKGEEFSVELVNFIYGLKHKGKKINVKKLEVKRQHLKSKIDVYIKVTTEESKIIHFVFENKLYSSPHSNQLLRHIKVVEEDYKNPWKKKEEKIEKEDEKVYIYFKLGYRYAEDMKDSFSDFRFTESAKEKEKLEKYIPKLKEYVELDRKQFIEFLDKNKLESDTFKMYFQYIKDIDDYYEKLKELISANRVLTEEERNRVFWSPVGGYEIFEKLRRKSDMNLRIRKGSNPDGRPWTQLDIKWEEVNSNWKGLFWRIDWRNNKKKKSGDSFTPYLRLNISLHFL